MYESNILSIIELVVAPVITAMVGYYTGRKKKDNDFLSELQGSIDMLSSKNRDLMDEVIKLRDQVVTMREENICLKTEVEHLRAENANLQSDIAHLRDENARQSELIEQLQQQLSGVRTITKVKQ